MNHGEHSHSIQRMRASRFAHPQLQPQWRLALAADAACYDATLKLMKIIALSVFLGFMTPSFAAQPYEEHVRNLAQGTPKEAVEASLRALRAAGTAAFPILTANFTNEAPAVAEFFARDAFTRLPDGSITPYAPSLGAVCFDLLQGQIEGNWPKGFRQYYVLSPSNAKSWLDAHKGLTLAQLRRISREESLRRAETDLAKRPASDLLKKAVAFLRQDLEDMKP